jgi:uncharacterized protein YjdB
MKTSKFLLIILSLSIWLAGCKADDDKVVLTGVVVNPTALEIAANDATTVAASPMPPNASDLVFSWTASQEGIVTLYPTDGPTTWVSGVAKGQVIVTVTCNGIPVEIPVTVVPAALRGVLVNETKVDLYSNSSTQNRFELVATSDPYDALNVTYEWSVEPEGIVSLSTVAGSTTTVTAEKIGDAIVTVRSGDFSKKVTVNVSREARLDYLVESVAAQWKFDDYNDFGKAAKGEDLEIINAVRLAPGPGGDDRAVEGTVGLADLRAHHGLTGESLENFTILWDAQYPASDQTSDAYYAGYWNGVYTGDASISVVYRTTGGNDYIHDPLMGTTEQVSRLNKLSVGSSGTYNVIEEPYYHPNYSPWMRIVLAVTKVDANNVRMDIWKNGVKVTDNAIRSAEQLKFTEGGWIYLLTDGGNITEDFHVGDDGDRPHPLANVAIWGFPVTNAEARLLGTVGTGL